MRLEWNLVVFQKTRHSATPIGQFIHQINFYFHSIGMMYTGELPIQYYMESISIDEEFEQLDQAITTLRTAIFVNLGTNVFFLLIIFFVVTFIYKLKKDFQKAQELEFAITEQYR